MQKILPALLCLLFSVSAYAQPTSAPPTPSQAAVDVISLFGESYTSATGLTPTTFGVNNNTAVVANEAGNEVYQFNVVDGDFQGFDLDEAIDLTAMENIHYDIWVEGTIDVGAIFNTTVSYHAGGHLTGQTTGYVHTNPIPTGQEGQWLSFDIPFNSFAPDLSTSPKDIISQLVFTFTNLTSTGPIYVDNIYFWKPPVDPAMDASLSDLQVDGATIDGFSPTELNYTVNVSSADPIPQITAATTTNMNATATITQAGAVPGQAMVEVTAEDGVTTQTYTVDFVLSISGPTTVPPAPTQAEADVISLFSDAYTSATGLTPTTFGVNNNTAAVVEAAGNDVYEFTIVDGDFQAFTLDDAIDLTTMENIHYDIWVGGTTNVGAIFNTVISYHADGHLTGQTTGYANTNPIAPGQEGQWLSFDIPFSNFAPDLAANPKDIISELVFAYTNLSDVGPIYMDNLYFWKTPTDPATDASLSDLQVDGATVEGFSPSELNYTVNVSEGAPVPQITAATTTNMNATAAITQAAAVPGQATVEVTAEDGVTMQTYTVDFILSTVGPTTAPPTPTQAEEDVISLFSDAYTSATGLTPTTFGANNNTAAVVEAAGNDVYEFTIVDGDFQAFTLDEAIDLTEMENLHYDIWVAGTTDVGAIFNTTISYHAGGHLTGQTTGYVHTNPIATGQEGQWLSFDIPFSNFAPDLAANPKDIISELVFAYTNLSDVGPIYMDNLYFWKTPTDPATDASLSDLQVDGATVEGFSPSELNYTVNVSEGAPVPQITAATTTNMNATAAITQATAVPGQATVEVTAEDGVTMQTYTVDFTVSIVGPTTAPPTPTIPASRVISLFSEAYTSATDLTPTTFGANNNTAAVVEAAGNDVYEFTIVDGDFQGFELGNAIDLTMMDTLHYDIWVGGTTDVGAIFNTTISYHAGGHLTGQTTGYAHTNPIAAGQEGQWLSFDIPFSSFAPDLAANPKDIISELVFVYTNLSDVGPIYIDNIYFYRDVMTSTPDVSALSERIEVYPNPTQLGEVVNFSEIPALIEVFSMEGRLLRTSKTGYLQTVGLQSGTYVLKITTEAGDKAVKKLILH